MTYLTPTDEQRKELAAFLDMIGSTEYQAIGHFRQDAIVDSRLYMTSELGPLGESG
jgi:hypothetical protein